MAARGRTPSPAQPSDDVLLAEIEVKHTWAKTWRGVLSILALGVLLLCSWPAAHALAGKDTALKFSFVLTFSVSIALAGVGAALWGASQRRQAKRLKRRNGHLSRDVKELQRRLRENGLSDDLTHS